MKELREYRDRLQWAMQLSGVSSSDLARKCGVRPQAISQQVTGKSKGASAKNLLVIARALGVDPAWLATGNGEHNHHNPTVDDVGHQNPRIERDACHETHEHQTVSEVSTPKDSLIGKAIVGWFPILDSLPGAEMINELDKLEQNSNRLMQATSTRCSPSSFYLKMEGKSMEPEIPDGFLVLVDPELKYQHGDIVATRNGSGNANIKMLSKDGDKWYLVPKNPDRAYRTEEMDKEAEVVGVIREIVKILR